MAERPDTFTLDDQRRIGLPEQMCAELGLGSGSHVWFLRGHATWEVWPEPQLEDALGAPDRGAVLHAVVGRIADITMDADAARDDAALLYADPSATVDAIMAYASRRDLSFTLWAFKATAVLSAVAQRDPTGAASERLRVFARGLDPFQRRLAVIALRHPEYRRTAADRDALRAARFDCDPLVTNFANAAPVP